MSATTVRRRYRFGPLRHRGVVGGLRGGQAATLAVGVLLALGAARRLPGAPGALLALCSLSIAAASAFVSVRGRGLDEWLPVAGRFARRRLRGEVVWRSPAPCAGTESDDSLVLPPELADVQLLAAPWRGAIVGVLKGTLDRTWTAVLAVQTHGLGLVELDEQEGAGDRWGAALASLAAEDSPVHRVAWVARSVPSDGDTLGRYLASERDADIAIEAPAMQSYLELVEEPGTCGKHHELFVAMQISASRARTQIREEGGGDTGACTVLLRELTAWAETLGAAQLTVRGVLTPRLLARVLRTHYDPFARAGIARTAARRGEDEGISPSQAAPTSADEAWSRYRTDGAVHTTYWVSSWPRYDVGMEFLAPLLLSGDAVRATAVTMEILSPKTAQTRVEHARTSDIADAAKQQRGGYLMTAARRRSYEATAAREDELSRGHALVRYVGFTTASSSSVAEHRRTCLQIETLARRSNLELRVMYGEQPAALTYTLPLCRGLR